MNESLAVIEALGLRPILEGNAGEAVACRTAEHDVVV
jgi:hypothetical protein